MYPKPGPQKASLICCRLTGWPQQFSHLVNQSQRCTCPSIWHVLLPLSERLWLAVQTVALAGPEKVMVKAVVVLPHITGSSAQ